MPIDFDIKRTSRYICNICNKTEEIEECDEMPSNPKTSFVFNQGGKNVVGCCLDHFFLAFFYEYYEGNRCLKTRKYKSVIDLINDVSRKGK